MERREPGVHCKCPDLITGIHGDDPVKVYQELAEVVQDVIDDFQRTGRRAAVPADTSDDGSGLAHRNEIS